MNKGELLLSNQALLKGFNFSQAHHTFIPKLPKKKKKKIPKTHPTLKPNDIVLAKTRSGTGSRIIAEAQVHTFQALPDIKTKSQSKLPYDAKDLYLPSGLPHSEY